MNFGMFVLGAVVFLISFIFFKVSAFLKTKDLEVSWKKLFMVFFIDYLILVIGVLGTGIIFVSLFNSFHG
tara:strand:- start:415 stop:624 length:210 start_codon:yes stop_codon:yes gene_type:complete